MHQLFFMIHVEPFRSLGPLHHAIHVPLLEQHNDCVCPNDHPCRHVPNTIQEEGSIDIFMSFIFLPRASYVN